jgi:hypothetical protein
MKSAATWTRHPHNRRLVEYSPPMGRLSWRP